MCVQSTHFVMLQNSNQMQWALLTFFHRLWVFQVEEEERTEVIDAYGSVDAEWIPDILARALGNRGMLEVDRSYVREFLS